jgi:rubrerythrin
MNTETKTPQTDAIAQNFHLIAATEKIQVAQYVKAWQCREIEEQVNHWKTVALQEQRHAAVLAGILKKEREDHDTRTPQEKYALSAYAEACEYMGISGEHDALDMSLAEAIHALASESKREAAGTADGKPDGQAENVNVELPPNGGSESKKDVVGG